jgi:hypothetical protein
MSKYMAREYVTIRGERGPTTGENPSSAIDVRSRLCRETHGWHGAPERRSLTDGTPLEKVEVKIDDGPWQPAETDRNRRANAWKFFSYQWKKPNSASTPLSRAIDAEGRVQPPGDDPPSSRTYWEANQQWLRKIRIEA